MAPSPHDAPVIREQLNRVLASPGFARNERLSRFLRWLVERHLEGRDHELKESLIAVEVFGRKPDYDPKADSIVRTEAARLRARLLEYYTTEGRADPVVIEVPKGGYVPAFRPIPNASPEVGRTPIRQRRYVLAAAAVIAVLGLAAFLWGRLPRHPATIAVLPLQNLTPDPGSDYFADGLTDEIIRNLSAIEGLEVRSGTSSFAFKGQPRNLRQIRTELGVDYIVEGSVLRTPDRLRVNARLVRTRDDQAVWSAKYDRALTDIFAVQDEISIGIVNSLRVRLGGGRRRYEGSVEAYDHYLRARVSSLPVALARPETGPALGEQAIRAFAEAITKDASFAPAHAGLATSLAMRSVQFPVDHPPDELPRMRAAAARAIELDPLLADAHAAMGLVHARDAEWEQAEARFQRAIALDRNRSSTYKEYAYWVLAVLGRHREAIDYLRLGLRTDPLSSDMRLTLAAVLTSAGLYDEAERECQALPSNGECLAHVRSGQGRYAEAFELLRHLPALKMNPQTRGFLGYAYARAGRRDEAEALLALAKYPNEQALILAGLGDKERTLEALDRMSAFGAQRVGLYLHYPQLALLRGDARAEAFRRRVGLPPSVQSAND